MFKCLDKNQEVIKLIPNSLVSTNLKRDFIKSRGELMQRSFITESHNKIVREWTLPKMLIIAQNNEKLQKLQEKQLEAARTG